MGSHVVPARPSYVLRRVRVCFVVFLVSFRDADLPSVPRFVRVFRSFVVFFSFGGPRETHGSFAVSSRVTKPFVQVHVRKTNSFFVVVFFFSFSTPRVSFLSTWTFEVRVFVRALLVSFRSVIFSTCSMVMVSSRTVVHVRLHVSFFFVVLVFGTCTYDTPSTPCVLPFPSVCHHVVPPSFPMVPSGRASDPPRPWHGASCARGGRGHRRIRHHTPRPTRWPRLPPSIPLNPSPSIPLSLTVYHSQSLSLNPSHPHSLSQSLSLTVSQSISLPHCLSVSIPLTVSQSQSPSPSLDRTGNLCDDLARWISLRGSRSRRMCGCERDRQSTSVSMSVWIADRVFSPAVCLPVYVNRTLAPAVSHAHGEIVLG